jgi:hypothetical protein
MRVFVRIALVVALGVAALPAFADHLLAECPLQVVATNPPSTAFYLSPHGIFRFNDQVFVLRGQTLSTYNVTALGDLQIAREDFIGTLGARETNGGVTFMNGFLYLSSEAGLEIYDLRGVRAGGTAPLLVSRTSGLHYRRLTVNSSNILVGVYPATDLPCYANGSSTCFNSFDIFNVSDPTNPVRIGSVSTNSNFFLGFNDVAFINGFLIATGNGGTFSFNMSNPALPALVSSDATAGTFLVRSNFDLVAVGTDSAVETYNVSSGGLLTPLLIHTISALQVDRANPIMFHPQGWIDEQAGRLIMMVDDKDPATLKPARTFAFDVFDYTVPQYEGSDPRVYEYVSYTQGDEVKYNPLTVGPYVYVVGENSGLQVYGACQIVTGHIDWTNTGALICGGTEIHGWVTGSQKIASVELFLDGGSLGTASLSGPPRTDVPSKTPVTPWRINVNLDATPAGLHLLRAIGTDSLGNRVQFASQPVLFGGPGQNCTTRRRLAGIH